VTRPVVTFDAGQTLVELDLDFLAVRLGERDCMVSAAALAAAQDGAWRHYDALVEAGVGHPWQGFMTALLAEAGVGAGAIAPLVEWLWREQPANNLWRRPIAGMVELARELSARGAVVAVLSNSEGRLADLLADIGIADAFAAIVDSGRVGVDKPDPRIFAFALDAVGARPGTRAIHVGDSWAADVLGALGAGWRAVWYRSRPGDSAISRPDVIVAHDVAGVRAAIDALL